MYGQDEQMDSEPSKLLLFCMVIYMDVKVLCVTVSACLYRSVLFVTQVSWNKLYLQVEYSYLKPKILLN